MNKSEIYKQINKLQSQIQEVEKDEIAETIKRLQSLEWVKYHRFYLRERGIGCQAAGLPTFELEFSYSDKSKFPLSFQSCYLFGDEKNHYEQVFFIHGYAFNTNDKCKLSCYSGSVLTEFVKRYKPCIVNKNQIIDNYNLYKAILTGE